MPPPRLDADIVRLQLESLKLVIQAESLLHDLQAHQHDLQKFLAAYKDPSSKDDCDE